MTIVLVTGPTRSGKSEWAEELAARSGKMVTYVATARVDPTDLEWQARIDRHQQRRPPEWLTEQVPIDLPDTIRMASETMCLLVDSLGTWLTNCLDQDDPTWERTVAMLLDSLKTSRGLIVMVAEETGWGLVPIYPAGRVFRDRLGDLTRQISALSNSVYLVTAGYVLDLTTLGSPLSRT